MRGAAHENDLIGSFGAVNSTETTFAEGNTKVHISICIGSHRQCSHQLPKIVLVDLADTIRDVVPSALRPSTP